MEQQSAEEEEAVAVRGTVRRFIAVTGLLMVGASVFIILVQPAYGPQHPLSFGVTFLILGLAELSWAWLGNWELPDAEQRARSKVKLKRIRVGGRIFEGAIVTLALLGLIYPRAFGTYWQNHKFVVIVIVATLVVNIVSRVVRHISGRSSRDESAESAS